MTARNKKSFIKQAQRCTPYNDGHWCFVYDPAHIPKLTELKSYDALIGFSAGIDTEKCLDRLGEESDTQEQQSILGKSVRLPGQLVNEVIYTLKIKVICTKYMG